MELTHRIYVIKDDSTGILGNPNMPFQIHKALKYEAEADHGIGNYYAIVPAEMDHDRVMISLAGLKLEVLDHWETPVEGPETDFVMVKFRYDDGETVFASIDEDMLLAAMVDDPENEARWLHAVDALSRDEEFRLKQSLQEGSIAVMEITKDNRPWDLRSALSGEPTPGASSPSP